MFEITASSAADYLRRAGRLAPDDPVEVRELVGGVSNVVLLVTRKETGEAFVLKQARGRLRVAEEWLCPVERIWREVEVLRLCGELLRIQPSENRVWPDEIVPVVPNVLWEDRENFVYAMTAAPVGHRTWKEILLAGETTRGLAVACGSLLGQLHAASWGDVEIANRLDDRSYFDQLRLDPYYRHVARVHPDLAPAVARLIDSVWQHRRCLVHGDFSPKNLLVWPGQMMLIDFEVGHYGDPAFDLGFFLTHLLLKSVWAGERRDEYLALATDFWREYRAAVETAIGPSEMAGLEERAMWNLAGCMLARVDGKSPVDYLSAQQRDDVRAIAIRWLVRPPPTWNEVPLMRNEY